MGGSGEPAAATGAAVFSSAAVYVAEPTIAISAVFVFFLYNPVKKNLSKNLGLVLSINIYIYIYLCIFSVFIYAFLCAPIFLAQLF